MTQFFLPIVKGRMACSAELLSIGMRPSDRKRRRNSFWLIQYRSSLLVAPSWGSVQFTSFAHAKKSSTLGFRCSCRFRFRSVLLRSFHWLSRRNNSEIRFAASAATIPSERSISTALTSSANYRFAWTQHPATFRPSRFFSSEW